MNNSFQTLYIEITETHFNFFVGESDDNNNYLDKYKLEVQIQGIEKNRVSDLDKAFSLIKKTIYLIEQKLNSTFKEIVLILENFNPSFINISGYKKLNGSQILKENITYILNSLKSYVSKNESKKKIVHIFNSNFCLDNKKIENLPIGLFGEFYSHELSFVLINKNDFKNLENIFDKCNLKIKKIFLKSFIKGAFLSENKKLSGNFFQIKIKKKSSKIFHFENNSLKHEQNFKFGTDIIIDDISKITSLKKEIVIKILNKLELKDDHLESEIIEKEFFLDEKFRKIKKKLIYEIALARIREISNLLIFQNVNFHYCLKSSKIIILEIEDEPTLKGLTKTYETVFSMNKKFNLNLIGQLPTESILDIANKLVHFGWNKEAIPITQTKKSIIARLFDAIFG